MSATTDLGKVGITVNGTWSGSVAYEKNSIVNDGADSYISIQDVPIGTALSNTAYWTLLCNGFSSAEVVSAVNAWLVAHPEATTTVQDGAVTTAKIADGAVTDAKLAQTGGVLEAVNQIDALLFNGSSAETVEIDQLASSVYTSLPLTYKWVLGIVPSGAVVEPIKVVVQGNSTAIVKLEKWVWTGSAYVLSETVTADTVAAYANVSGSYLLTFNGFTASADTLLTFTDSSSGGWVRFLNNATGYTAKRFPTSLSTVTESDFLESANTEILYYLKYTTAVSKIAKYTNIVVVDSTGKGDYTNVVDAVANEPEGSVIRIMPGIYEGTVQAFQKRIILIGTDRNTCILKSTDGRYEYPVINGSCGYLENLTLISEYVNGTSNEIDRNTSGAYAFHCENEYGIGKTLEFHHCRMISDFFPALGAGLRKDFRLILDDCELVNNQIVNRGAYSNLTEGSLGALYFHDSIGTQGDQYITVKNCVLKSALGTSMTLYQVPMETQNNRVFCEFIGNVLHDERHGYVDNIWFRGDPFNADTGIFEIEIGFGNSNSTLNNN